MSTAKKPVKKETLKVGRPTVMTKEAVGKLEQAYALGCTDGEACFYADISQETLYEYQRKFPEFIHRKESLKQKPILQARQSVVKSFEGNPELALKFLERKLKKEFSLRQEVTGEDGAAINPIIQVEVINSKSNE